LPFRAFEMPVVRMLGEHQEDTAHLGRVLHEYTDLGEGLPISSLTSASFFPMANPSFLHG